VDAQTRADLEDLIRSIWERTGVTTLFVTHDIDEAVYLGQRVIVLSSSPTTSTAVFMGSRVVVMSARPGRTKLDRAVLLPHPRHYSVKTTPAFTELKAELTEQVRVEVRAAQAMAA